MQSRMEMLMQVMNEHGGLLTLLDRITEISFVRVRSHFKQAYQQYLEEKQSGSLPEEEGVSFLVVANFLAERACYTAEAVSCLLWHGYSDSAYELWRTLFNLELNVSKMIQSSDPEHTAKRYLSATLEDLNRHETKLVDVGLKGTLDAERLATSVGRLRHEFEGIERQEGWIDNKEDRRTAKRAEQAGMQVEYAHDYDLASKSAHGAAISLLKRPSAYFPKGGGKLPPVAQSTTGIEIPAILAAKSLCSVADKFIYGTRESESPEEASWVMESNRTFQELALLAMGSLSQGDSVPA